MAGHTRTCGIKNKQGSLFGDLQKQWVAAAVIVMALPVYADDPLATINALSDFVFSAIKAISAILLASALYRSVLPSKATMPGSVRRAL